MQKTWVWSLGQEDPLEKGMATHSNILAWRIPWIQEPVGSMGSQRVGQDWVTNTFTFFITQHTSCTIYMRVVVQLFSHDWLFETPWTAARQASLSFTISRSLLKLCIQSMSFPILHYIPEFAQTCPLSQWCHPTISSSVTPFSSCPQSFPASGSFPMMDHVWISWFLHDY